MDNIKYYFLYQTAYDTCCPFLRCGEIDDKIYHVADNVDPCPLKKCRMNECENYGKPYNHGRLVIFNDKGEVKSIKEK